MSDAAPKRKPGRPKGTKDKVPRKRVAKGRAKAARDRVAQAQSTAHRGVQVDAIAVDARLEETGQATEPQTGHIDPKSLAPPGSVYGQTGSICAKCQRRRGKRYFSVITRKTETTPLVRDSVCQTCRVEEQASDLKAQRIQRAADRQAKTEYRKLAKAAAQKKAHAMRANYMEGAKKTQATLDEGAIEEHVRRELARRELARRRLLYFTRRFEGQQVDEETGDLVEIERAKGAGYLAGWVHKDICARLERFYADVRAGKQPRLMLFMPPRHGKSTLASRMFPAWVLGQDPTVEIIAASYGSSLPETFSRNVRGLLRDEEYQAIFPITRLDPEKENVQGWSTTKGGQYIPAGVGSGISGKGADILVIDDPFKGAEDAENPNMREKVLDWYFSEANARLSPRAGTLIILTRWHDADLAGALLSSQEEQEKESREILESELSEIAELGLVTHKRIKAESLVYAEHKERLRDVEKWEVVSYAAVAEDDEYRMPSGQIVNYPRNDAKLLRRKGEALHPDRYPLDRLRQIRKGFYARGRQRFWHALYQQKPVPDEGLHFSRDMVVLVPHPGVASSHHWTRLSAWDLAAGQKRQHDYTVGVHGLLDHDGRMVVTELIRGRFKGAYGVACEVLDEFERNTPRMIAVEKGPLEQFLMPGVDKELEDRNKGRGYKDRLTPVFATGEFAWTPIHDLDVMAGPLQSVMQQKKLVFSQDLRYIEEMIQELIRFPNGVHDDIVSALAGFVRLALKHSAPRKPTLRQRKKSWKDRLKAHVRGAEAGHMAA